MKPIIESRFASKGYVRNVADADVYAWRRDPETLVAPIHRRTGTDVLMQHTID